MGGWGVRDQGSSSEEMSNESHLNFQFCFSVVPDR